MKRFLVTDEMGNPVYVDAAFDADRSTLLCLPFATTQDMMQARLQTERRREEKGREKEAERRKTPLSLAHVF